MQYDVEHHPDWSGEETLVIRTNADGAEDFKIVSTPLARPGRENWRDLVPHRRGVYVLAITVLRGLADPARARGRPAAHRGAPARRAARSTRSRFAEEAYSLGTESGYEFATDSCASTIRR